MLSLENKIAVITGGSKGIGLAIAEIFALNGADIVIFSRSIDNLTSAKNKLQRINSRNKILAIQGDIRKNADIELLYTETYKQLGGINILVANAGIGNVCSLSKITETIFDSIVSTNYKGTFFTIQKAVPYLSEGASIILLSSVLAHIAFPERSLYSSTKAALSMLTRCFAADLIDKEIRVNAISAGYTETDILKNSSKDFLDKLRKKVPLKRFGLPKEIAQLALFLASNNSSYITGSDIIIDGGLSRFDRYE